LYLRYGRIAHEQDLYHDLLNDGFIQRQTNYVSISNIFHVSQSTKKTIYWKKYDEKKTYQFFVSKRLFTDPDKFFLEHVEYDQDNIYGLFLNRYVYVAQVKDCIGLNMIPFENAKGNLFE
jgi:hypothetical protein